ncbi:MAG: DUF4157 domain-containing protein, partial [Chitinophagaceae bacterium]
CKKVNAKAFTHNQDIYFNKGQYNPEQLSGTRLLAHELTHVAQSEPETIMRQVEENQSLPGVESYDQNMSLISQADSTDEELVSTPAVFIQLDQDHPWLFTVTGANDETSIAAEIYGPVSAMPVKKKMVVTFNGLVPQYHERYVTIPTFLQPYYMQVFEHAMQARKAELDSELSGDVNNIKRFRKHFEVMDDYSMGNVEDHVIKIITRWAHESFPKWQIDTYDEKFRSRYLDQLFLELSTPYLDEGIVRDIWRSDYGNILNNFERANEIKALRDKYSAAFNGSEPIAEPPGFFSILWEDVKNGEVRDRIFNYFKGLAEAGKGLLEGLHTLFTDPGK